MTKQQIIGAVRECTDKLGHVPSHTELLRITHVSRKQIRWHFGTYTRLLRECNLEKRGGGFKLEMDALLRDWAGLVRDMKKLPSLTEYEHFSKYSTSPLLTRFGVWAQVPHGLKLYIEEQGRMEEMRDVLKVIEAQGHGVKPGKTLRPHLPALNDCGKARKHVRDEAIQQGPGNVFSGPDDELDYPERMEICGAGDGIYGRLMRYGPMVCAPTNEQGALFLFGAMAERLGFALLKIGTSFPDCEVFRVVDGDRLERIKAEIEYESRNFLKHMHDVKGCELIICWRHNWPECPLPVIELRSEINKDQTV